MSEPPVKKQKIESPNNSLGTFSSPYYPRSSTLKLAKRYDNDGDKPYYILQKRLDSTESSRNSMLNKISSDGKLVAHMFLRDLRMKDNVALHKASMTARKLKVPLVTFWVICLESWKTHSMSPFQATYRLESLKLLQKKLKKQKIPLYIVEAEKKSEIASCIESFCKSRNIGAVFTNMEYEVDELRLLSSLNDQLAKNNIAFNSYNDTCLVKPGTLSTKQGGQFKVFKPWFNCWLQYLKDRNEESKEDEYPFFDYELVGDINENFHYDENDKALTVPGIPTEYELTASQRQNFDDLYHLGEESALKTVKSFLSSPKLTKYSTGRGDLSKPSTSRISHYLANGIISLRTIMSEIITDNSIGDKSLNFKGSTLEYVRQLAWRDYYKHVIAHWPTICMYQSFTGPMSEDLEWENDASQFEKWCEGMTGYPVIDASIRELVATGYTSNRNRMIAASFLVKHLLIDWRYGERWFMEHLVDGDFASNNGGWGFISSFGVNSQPWFRIMNPWTQSEKFDAAKYIKKWVPELKDIPDNKVHNPYSNGFSADARANGYPEPMVEHSKCRERALDWYDRMKN
ncbi:deoxyribodipyrimidine photo-lyase [Saccharomycopsis crataegensis]|uniref:Deoxyribodipyrimidine photo-lyase n=1 Tax=Saccharomycopsis crataegensis TaxID=43959 RepID=A0AAV5QIS8_9ASCO|nr:deoxyribodipyrimidine photo-lyase [Saccharomycopsis crataegensis]